MDQGTQGLDRGAPDDAAPPAAPATPGTAGSGPLAAGLPDTHRSDGIAELLAALEGADDLPLDDRLALLRRAEEGISGVLEGLDGL